MSEVDPGFFAAVRIAAQPTDSLTDYDARLICDLVANIREPADVLKQYGLSAADLQAKARNPMFAAAYRETERVWKSDMNIQTRVRLKAAFLLEDSLVPLHKIVTDVDMPVRAKLEAIEQLTKISTVANVPKEGAGSGEKHNIIINIGGDRPPVKIVAESNNERSTAIIPA
jgi:hypothetical protein